MQLGCLLLALSGTATAQTPPPMSGEPAPVNASLAGDVVELDNPAFPTARVEPLPALTPLADLVPPAAHSPLLEAAAALDAGQPASALKLLSGLPDNSGVRYLRTLALLRLSPSLGPGGGHGEARHRAPGGGGPLRPGGWVGRRGLGGLTRRAPAVFQHPGGFARLHRRPLRAGARVAADGGLERRSGCARAPGGGACAAGRPRRCRRGAFSAGRARPHRARRGPRTRRAAPVVDAPPALAAVP